MNNGWDECTFGQTPGKLLAREFEDEEREDGVVFLNDVVLLLWDEYEIFVDHLANEHGVFVATVTNRHERLECEVVSWSVSRPQDLAGVESGLGDKVANVLSRSVANDLGNRQSGEAAILGSLVLELLVPAL